MSTRAERYDAVVTDRRNVSPHLLRLTLSVPGLSPSGIADEWVGLVAPGQFQVALLHGPVVGGDRLVLDVVVHAEGLVTDWATGDCVGDRVVVTAPQGSFEPPAEAAWLLLVGDLTAMPAMRSHLRVHLVADADLGGGPRRPVRLPPGGPPR